MSLVIKTTGFENYLDPSGGFYVKCLIVGTPDVGKTRSASFWPKPLFAMCEDGAMSLADRKVPHGRVTSTQDMDDMLDEAEKDSRLPLERRKYGTFVVDTFDAYQRLMIAERLKAENKIALSGWGDWGYLDAKMNQFLIRLMNLPMNIVVNLHPKAITEGDDEKSTTLWAPRLKGDIKDQIFGEFDLVGFMENTYIAEQGKRVRKRMIRWHNEPTFPFLKDRSGRLPRFTDIDFSENDYWRIFNAIVGEHVESLPKQEVLGTIGSEPVTPAPADVEGGAVAVDPAKLPAKKVPAKKAAAKKVALAKEVNVKAYAKDEPTPEPEPESGTTDEPAEPTPSTDVDEAAALVTGELGGEVVADTTEPTAPEVAGEDEKPARTNVTTCGSQTPAMAGKFPPAAGCGKSLEGESNDRINISILKAKTRLCADCFEAFKTAS